VLQPPGASLSGTGGDVADHHVELDGDEWTGSGLDVDFPVTVQGRIGRSLDVRLSEGGRTVRAVTTNGGVKIVRAGALQIR
jgi:hypothetical protein